MPLSTKNSWRCAVGLCVLSLGAMGCGPEESIGDTNDELSAGHWCEAKGGQIYTDPGDGSLHDEGCPDGKTNLGNVDIGIEGGLCCKQP